MRRRFIVILTIALTGCGVGGAGGGSGGGIIPLPVPVPFFIPIPAEALLNTEALLEGQWAISDSSGSRSCLVIQERRVSIVDVSCSSNGSGLSSRIFDAPIISRAGQTIILRVTYNLRADPERTLRLTFTGELQIDGSFQGFRQDEDLTDGTVIPERFAIMTRL